MARLTKKPTKEVVKEVPKVWSSKYGCWITQSAAYFDESTNDWLNLDIEENLKNNINFNAK